MHHIQGISRNQMSFFALEQLVSQDSWARLVDVFVDTLPLDELGFKHVTLEEEGRPPFHPSVLLKLYMYGYKHGIRSSRKLEHASKVNIELWWLLEGQTPSDRTIAAFRKKNKKAFKNAFRYFVLMLKEWDLISGDVIAIDLFKIRAQNSLKNNFNQKKINRHIEYIDNKIEENVLSEVNILFMVYNLRRIMSILGPNELKERLKSLISNIFQKVRPILPCFGKFKHQLAKWNICFVKILFSQNAHRYAYIE